MIDPKSPETKSPEASRPQAKLPQAKLAPASARPPVSGSTAPWSTAPWSTAPWPTAFPMAATGLEDWLTLQQRGLDIMLGVNRVLADGAQRVLQRQAELTHAMIEDLIEDMRNALSDGNLNERALRRIDCLRKEYERLVAATRDLSDTAAASGREMAELVSRGVARSQEEMKPQTRPAAVKPGHA